MSINQTIELSIIVPVYNVKTWLHRCLSSIVTQKLDSYELILVDDGSTDGCGEILDIWCEQNPKSKVIHKPNGGLSDARNVGIDAANGRYITFIDSDDYLAANTLESVLCQLRNNPEIDFIEYSAKLFVGGINEKDLSLSDCIFYDADSYWLKSKAYSHSYAWNKIYKRELFNNIRFPRGKVFEDVYTLPLIISASKMIATTSLGGYQYCWNSSGITATASGKEIKMLLEAHLPIIDNYLQNSYNNNSCGKKDFSDYYLHVLNIQITTYLLTSDTPTLQKFRPIPHHKLKLKDFIKAVLLNFMSVHNLCILTKKIAKHGK